ncbi:M15 family metallopeptidase [Pseudobutyrivibrio sp.]|uniref:M15 family metallopeptidase n=1 Tax=Pseudobutyrivibrio sp. TaxID=2014367 RepID=UPI0025D4B76D|nr:M15 family metallopeptidase [Pseudobutyrivibrio sp.]
MLMQKFDDIKNRILNWKYSRPVGVVLLIAILVGISFRVSTFKGSDVYAKAEISEELREHKDAVKRDEVEPSNQTTQVLPVAKEGETIMNTADVKDKANFYAVEFTEESEIFERIKGKSYKDNCTVPLSDLRYLHVLYVGFDGQSHDGEIICNKYIADDLLEIFEELYEAKYPIEKIKLVDEYNADDEASMADNNSSSFNFRFISYTTKISKHGYGLAIDINTLYNPYVKTVNGKLSIEPANAADYVDRSKDFDYKIDEEDLAYKLFIAHGFEWGGSWKNSKDYQHFEVPDSVVKSLYK